jgi:predicted permease
LHNLESGDGGYHTRQLLLARLDLRYSRLTRNLPNAAGTLLDAVQRLPGVEAASISISAPVINDLLAISPEEVPGYVAASNERPPRFNAVSPHFFTTTGIGLVAGREFDHHDVVGAEPVVIISQAFAHHYFSGQDPIGRSLTLQLPARHSARIIGVAHDAQYDNPRAAPTEVWYMPLYQEQPADVLPSFALSVRTDIDPVSVATSIRRALARVAPDVGIRQLSSVGQLLDDALARERFAAGLASFFGLIALGLCALGVYGVTAQNVAARRTEIGVRMALGATPRDALWIAMKQSLTIAGAGLAIGIPLALAANRAIVSQLYGVAPSDPRVMVGAACMLACAAAIAGFVPGRRAARVDPAVALRSD